MNKIATVGVVLAAHRLTSFRSAIRRKTRR